MVSKFSSFLVSTAFACFEFLVSGTVYGSKGSGQSRCLFTIGDCFAFVHFLSRRYFVWPDWREIFSNYVFDVYFTYFFLLLASEKEKCDQIINCWYVSS